MGIYQRIELLSGEQENHFAQKCDEVESYFAQALISLGVDLSTAALAKAAADGLEIKIKEVARFTSPIMIDFLENIEKTPRLLTKFNIKTGLTVRNGDVMTVARAALRPANT